MPLPLTVSWFSEIQIGFTFLVLAHLGNPWQRDIKRVYVCVCCFCNVCSAAVRHHPEYRKATDTAIDAVVREWLRTAGDQDGGRKYRYHRSQSQPVSDGHQQRTMLGDRVFPVTAARAWNALASSVRSASWDTERTTCIVQAYIQWLFKLALVNYYQTGVNYGWSTADKSPFVQCNVKYISCHIASEILQLLRQLTISPCTLQTTLINLVHWEASTVIPSKYASFYNVTRCAELST